MLIFRLTAEEYENLQRRQMEAGVPSLSEYARRCLVDGDPHKARIKRIEEKIDRLLEGKASP